MSTANTFLRVTDLDFNEIKNNLKTHLATNDKFKDFNFEGSVMSNLLDVLAYNTHYNAYYVNMLANEMFLDTAQQRDSVVSRAKELGYVSSSSIGSSANVNIVFGGIPAEVTNFTISKNSTFTSEISDITYTYVVPEAKTVVVNQIDGSGTGSTATVDLTIKEGEPLASTFIYDSTNPERFVIPNKNVDTSSILVKVQTSSSDSTLVEFHRATNVNQVYSTSEIYFLEEAYDEKYEIVFGDGALGKRLVDGNIVVVQYLVCNGGDTNGADTFAIDHLNMTTTYTSATIETNKKSSGGRFQENVESIKFNAPRSYQTQNRAVINNDYERIILNENSDLQSVVAYGGEHANPKLFGKVIIAAKPFGEEYITENRKRQIKASIMDRTPLGIDPIMIDPDYTYLKLNITTRYDKTKTKTSESSIRASIIDAANKFSTENLERFGRNLRYSNLLKKLDSSTEAYVLSNAAEIKLEKRISPDLNVASKVNIDFNNPIRKLSVTSSQFTYNGFISYISDDGLGNISIYRFGGNKEKIIVINKAGTIDYSTGNIQIENFAPTSHTDIYLKILAFPERLDVSTLREQVLIIDPNDTKVNVISEYT